MIRDDRATCSLATVLKNHTVDHDCPDAKKAAGADPDKASQCNIGPTECMIANRCIMSNDARCVEHRIHADARSRVNYTARKYDRAFPYACGWMNVGGVVDEGREVYAGGTIPLEQFGTETKMFVTYTHQQKIEDANRMVTNYLGERAAQGYSGGLGDLLGLRPIIIEADNLIVGLIGEFIGERSTEVSGA
jgi:hypothetical protein